MLVTNVQKGERFTFVFAGFRTLPTIDWLSDPRRSWRIGQRRPVEVKFFAYKGTIEEVCLRLMGKNLLVALAIEGKFASEGLQVIDGDDDMLTAMARELIENKGIGESADSVWRNVRQLRPSTSAGVEGKPSEYIH